MSQNDILGLPQYRLLDVRALRHGSSFRWEIRESDGRLIESSSDAYSTDREAIRAANRAARAIKKQCSTPEAPHVRSQALRGGPRRTALPGLALKRGKSADVKHGAARREQSGAICC
jgi:hypothetical protein